MRHLSQNAVHAQSRLLMLRVQLQDGPGDLAQSIVNRTQYYVHRGGRTARGRNHYEFDI